MNNEKTNPETAPGSAKFGIINKNIKATNTDILIKLIKALDERTKPENIDTSHL